jgi:hypothetical protein
MCFSNEVTEYTKFESSLNSGCRICTLKKCDFLILNLYRKEMSGYYTNLLIEFFFLI